MSEMVERVARRLGDCGVRPPPGSDHFLETIARAVIAAMRANSTAAMISAAAEVWPDLDDSTDAALYGGLFNAMIDAALK